MDKDDELYREEQLQVTKEMRDSLANSVVVPVPKFPDEMKAKIVNEVTARLVGDVTVDSKPFEDLGKGLADELNLFATVITKAIQEAKPELIKELKVSNLADAKADEVTVKNLGELQTSIERLTRAVLDNDPVINVDKQEVVFPRSPRDAIPVRLSDGKSFYNAIMAAASGGGPSKIQIINASGEAVSVTNGKLDVNATVEVTDLDVRNLTFAQDKVDASGSTVTETNSAAIATSLSVLDDWDESDRAKVNLIAGQVGVAAGSGTVSGSTQRVVLATNVALPAGTNEIGKLAANSGVDIGDVDVTSVVPGTGATNLGKAEDTVHTTGDTGVMALGVRNSANYATLTSGDGDYSPFAVDGVGAQLVAGNTAHDNVDIGGPIKMGAQARTTNPTAVADADRVNFIADKLGKQVVVGAIRDLKVRQFTTITSSTTETTILTAGAASVFHDVYLLHITNTSATACEVTIRDATGGSVIGSYNVPAGDSRGFELDAGSAEPQATAANNWTAQCGSSVASIKIKVLAVKNT